MMPFTPLNFPSFIFRLRDRCAVRQIWDPLRGDWLVLTPEEWVRQHLIRYLQENQRILPAQIVQEHPVVLGGANQRADVVVYDIQARPLLVVECKAPEVTLNREVFAQVIRYNSVLQAPYVAVTNGLAHYCSRKEDMTACYGPVEDFMQLTLLP